MTAGLCQAPAVTCDWYLTARPTHFGTLQWDVLPKWGAMNGPAQFQRFGYWYVRGSGCDEMWRQGGLPKTWLCSWIRMPKGSWARGTGRG